jgi:hypothetical protein
VHPYVKEIVGSDVKENILFQQRRFFLSCYFKTQRNLGVGSKLFPSLWHLLFLGLMELDEPEVVVFHVFHTGAEGSYVPVV